MAVYEIRLRGHIDPEWSEWLDGFAITNEADGESTLVGTVPDQAVLFGLLAKVRDLGLPLLAVQMRDGDRDARRCS